MSQDLNNTMNGTQPSSCYWNRTVEKIGKTVAYCLIILVSLAGNTVIGIIVYKTKTMRKRINFFIVNMAMSDLLVPTFVIPWEIQRLYTNSWLIGGSLAFGDVLCKLVLFLPYVSFAVSVQSLVLLTVDRFGAVVYPLRTPLISSRLCPFFILVTWIVASAFLFPVLFNKLVEYRGGFLCLLDWKEAFGESFSQESYLLSWVVIFILFPLLLITILYITIYTNLKSHKIPGQQSASAGQQRQQREGNVLKMSIAIVVGFAVCMLPLAIFWFLFFVSDIWSCGFLYLWSVAIFMARVNCAMNPCICFIFSRNYRIGLKTLFK